MLKRLLLVGAVAWCVLLVGAVSAVAQTSSDGPVGGPSRLVRGLSVSYGVLQGLEVYTTRMAVEHGAVVSNPLMRGVAGNTAALAAVKGGLAVSTIWLLDRASRQRRGAAIAEAIAVNALSAFVVAHNYAVLGGQKARGQ